MSANDEFPRGLDRNRERDHNWQFRMLAATILLTNVGNVVAAILMHR